MKHGLGLNKILSTTYIYPTMAEANRYAARAWKRSTVTQGQWVFSRPSTSGAAGQVESAPSSVACERCCGTIGPHILQMLSDAFQITGYNRCGRKDLLLGVRREQQLRCLGSRSADLVVSPLA
jgi:hypothetical protein